MSNNRALDGNAAPTADEARRQAPAEYSDGVNDGLSIAKSLIEQQLAMKVRAPNEAEEAWAKRVSIVADTDAPHERCHKPGCGANNKPGWPCTDSDCPQRWVSAESYRAVVAVLALSRSPAVMAEIEAAARNIAATSYGRGQFHAKQVKSICTTSVEEEAIASLLALVQRHLAAAGTDAIRGRMDSIYIGTRP